jgi:surfactin synthase thioesterase subunit
MYMSDQQTFPRTPIRYISGRSDTIQVSRQLKVSLWTDDTRSPVRMELVLGSHLFRVIAIDCDYK